LHIYRSSKNACFLTYFEFFGDFLNLFSQFIKIFTGSVPRPGEISLAHRGVLFLDELPEFDRRVLDVLREPMESGRITISRAARQADFPACFQLIAAMNPCFSGV